MKSYTDLEQSKKLAEILPIESADMYYSKYDTIHANTLYGSCDIRYFNINEYIPCWSLAALFGVLPHRIDDRYGLALGKLPTNEGWYVCYVDNDQFLKHYVANSNFIDACYEIILRLHEAKLI